MNDLEYNEMNILRHKIVAVRDSLHSSIQEIDQGLADMLDIIDDVIDKDET